MVKWMKSCDVKQQIMGSDHCPVSCEFYEEIEENGQKVKLTDLISSNSYIIQNKLEVPKLCAKNLSKFSSSQTKLQKFFNKSIIKDDETTNARIIDNANANDTVETNIFEKEKTTQKLPSKPTSKLKKIPVKSPSR